MWDWLLLFVSSFLAANILPYYSEYLVADWVTTTPHLWLWIWAVASFANALGSLVNWGAGSYLLHFQDRRWFPIRTKDLEKAQRWFGRFGKWSLLATGLPVAGDALTVAAGALKIRPLPFFVLVFFGKSLRYAFVVYMAFVLV